MSTTEPGRPAAPTEVLPAVPVRKSILHLTAQDGRCPFADWRGRAQTEELPAVARVSASAKPAGSRVARHLRAALVGITLAAALLTGLQLYAAQGIADARRAALEQASSTDAPASPYEAPQAGWLIEGTSVAAPSPLDLPRCTTSPDTPLPCLATISPDSTRAVVLEEDASLTP